MKIAYVTDSGTGYSINEMAENKVFSLPLQLSYDDQNFFDLEQIKTGELISLLKQSKVIKTSLPNLGLTDELFRKLKEEQFEKIIAVPICSGLSGTMNSFYLKAQEYDISISCVDTHTTAEIQKYLINFFKDYINDDEGKINEAFEIANEVIDSANTLIVPNDLNHLKRGGRLSPAANMLANLLKIKPILKINKDTSGRIEAIDKVRTFSKALSTAIDIIINDINDQEYLIYIAHVDNYGDAATAKEKLEAQLTNAKINIIPLCNSVAAHCGLGTIAIQYFKKISDY